MTFDFSRDRTFDGLVTASTTQTIPARLTYGDFDSGTVKYTASTEALASFGSTIVPNTNGATLSRTSSSLRYSYLIATSGTTQTINKATSDAIYVSYIRADELVKPLSITRFALIGAPTLVSDLPSTGTSTYQFTVAEIGAQSAGQTFAIDWAFKRIDGTVSLLIPGVSGAVLATFRGSINSSNGRFDGAISTSGGAYTGTFQGRIYGPAGSEIGTILNLTDGKGDVITGVILGRTG